MPKLSVSDGEVLLDRAVNSLSKAQREKLIEGYDLKLFAKVFEDRDMMGTLFCFFSENLNVSETARKLYMHRNTLIYRLNKIKRTTGLDVRNFYEAETFRILHTLYILK